MINYKYVCLEYIEGGHYAVLSKFSMKDLGYSKNFKLNTSLELKFIYKEKLIDGIKGIYRQEYLNEKQSSLPYLKINGESLTERDSIIVLMRNDELCLVSKLFFKRDLEDVALSSTLKTNILQETECTETYIQTIYKDIKKENEYTIPYKYYYKSISKLIENWILTGQLSLNLLRAYGNPMDYKYYTTEFSHIKAITKYTLKTKGIIIKKQDPLKNEIEVEEIRYNNKFKYHVKTDFITWFYQFLQGVYTTENTFLVFNLYDIIQDLVQYIKNYTDFDIDLIMSLFNKANIQINRKVYELGKSLSAVTINSIYAHSILKNFRSTGFLLDYKNTENLKQKFIQLYKDAAKYKLLNRNDISLIVNLTGGLKIRGFKIIFNAKHS